MTTKPQLMIEPEGPTYASLRDAMLALARERLPEWTDHSPNDLGVTLVELFAAMGDSLAYYLDRVASESFLDTAQEPRSVFHLLRLIGCELRPELPASAGLTLLFKTAKDPGDPTPLSIVIPRNAAFATPAKLTGAPVGFQYVRAPLTIDWETLPVVTYQGKQYKVFRNLPVVQVDQSVANEVIGSSDGGANQRFAIPRKPLIASTLQISVLQPNSKIWRRVDSLIDSAGTGEDHAIRRDENGVAWVEFGDGVHGKPPARGRNNVLASYSVGGGARGNVRESTIVEIKTPLKLLDKVYNEAPATGGFDRESLAEAAQRAPRQFRSMGRAVTAADFEAHARSFGVAKARARGVGNRVELWVAPAGGGYPSDLLKDDLRAYLEERRMSSTRLEILDPVYVPITLAATVEIEPYFQRLEVESRVRAAIRELWSFNNVEFADTLYVSKVYEAIEAIEGVAGVTVTHFALGDGPNLPQGALKLGFGELPVSTGFAANALKVIGGKS